MLSVVIPTRNSEQGLALTLSSLVSAAADGTVREVVVVDGGSADGTGIVADAAGCLWLDGPVALGERLALGAATATRGEWLLFLRPGIVVEPGWQREVASLIERIARSGDAGKGRDRVIVFRHALDDIGLRARVRELSVAIGSRLVGVPHRTQGLLISRAHYRRIGGFRPLPVLEDVDLFRRIGRFRSLTLRARASVVAYGEGNEDGALRRLRRATCRALAALWVPPRYLVRLHGPGLSTGDFMR